MQVKLYGSINDYLKFLTFLGKFGGAVGNFNAHVVALPVELDPQQLADRLYNTYKCVVKGEYIDPDLMISFDSDGLDDIQGLRSELCRLPRKLDNDTGLEQLLSKKEMKTLGIDSPNMADPVMMSLFIPTVKKKRKELKYNKMSIA